jgi:hypothetical protein
VNCLQYSLILNSTSKDSLKPQVKAEDVNGRVDTVLEELRGTRNEVSSLRSKIAVFKAASLACSATTVEPHNVRYLLQFCHFHTSPFHSTARPVFKSAMCYYESSNHLKVGKDDQPKISLLLVGLWLRTWATWMPMG